MQTIDPFPGHYDSSDAFGSTRGRKYPHTGSDWNRQEMPESIVGEPAPAMAAGTVVFAGWEPTGGNGYVVCVDMGNGLYWAYLHLARTPFVSVGERVELGDHVGVVGNTGSNSVGGHLHATVSDSPRAYQGMGNKIDPWRFIQDHLTVLGANAAPQAPAPKKGKQTMRILKNKNTGRTYGIAPGFVKHHASDLERSIALKAEGQDSPVEFDNNEFAVVLFDYGLEVAVQINAKGEPEIDYFNALPSGHTTVAPWNLER